MSLFSFITDINGYFNFSSEILHNERDLETKKKVTAGLSRKILVFLKTGKKGRQWSFLVFIKFCLYFLLKVT